MYKTGSSKRFIKVTKLGLIAKMLITTAVANNVAFTKPEQNSWMINLFWNLNTYQLIGPLGDLNAILKMQFSTLIYWFIPSNVLSQQCLYSRFDTPPKLCLFPLKWFYCKIAFHTKYIILSYSTEIVSTLLNWFIQWLGSTGNELLPEAKNIADM